VPRAHIKLMHCALKIRMENGSNHTAALLSLSTLSTLKPLNVLNTLELLWDLVS